MKLFVSIGVFLLFLAPFTTAKSFDLGNLFHKNLYNRSPNKTTTVQTDALIESERVEESNASMSSNFSKELGSGLFSSSEELESFSSTSSGSHDGVDQSESVSNESTTSEVRTLSTIQDNESQSESSSYDSSSVPDDNSTKVEVTMETEEPSSVVTEEKEEVVMATIQISTVPVPKTILQKSIEWVEDAYTLSILMPIAAGVLFATSIILTIACCRCVRRCCRRRRFKRKALPDSIKNLRPSDRARLLGDTSDEEF